MRLELLETHQVDQLSACPNALALGVFSHDNKIERFLKLARLLLDVEKAIFAFHHEPYMWIATPDYDFKPFLTVDDLALSHCFNGELIIAEGHENYLPVVNYYKSYGLVFQRILCFDFKLDSGESIGQIAFYDRSSTAFSQKQKDLLIELSTDLTTILQQRYELQTYHELYEEQRALNFSKTKFLQIIAHDLRAPFHGLIGFTDVLTHERETLDEDSLQDISSYLYDTLQSTYGLLESLLNWAMAEGGRFVYHPINFKLKQTTKIVYDVLNGLAKKKNIELIEDVDENLSVYADMNMLTSIIQNLVSNSLKFTHTDGSGRVEIRGQRVDQNIQIAISDTGLGMTPAQLEKVFEPQIKVSVKGTTGEKGTGLGLVLCKRFVDLNQGQISVVSQQGRGTTFTVTLPVATSSHQNLQSNVEYGLNDVRTSEIRKTFSH